MHPLRIAVLVLVVGASLFNAGWLAWAYAQTAPPSWGPDYGKDIRQMDRDEANGIAQSIEVATLFVGGILFFVVPAKRKPT